MAVFKCKMCGGELDIHQGMSVAECPFCGTKQTLPRLDNDKKINLYDRADYFRRNNEYDKAADLYEKILLEDKTDAEAYWSLVLCKYGVEYVEDPETHKRVPTINRAQYTSVFLDEDYQKAIEYADGYQKDVYQEEAKTIDDIQKGILEISNKEDPFDVFICYKETDEQGRRTHDSVYAQDIYNNLTNEGYKVFFSRITLEDKLGTAYEPYIFAALNSAKIMIVVGTNANNFNAVWVKNEWSRYLALIKNGEDKILIPVYRDMNPYDLPEEFAYLQGQDMSKLGFMQDLIRGVKKITEKIPSENIIEERHNSDLTPMLKRAFMFLEDGEFSRADEFCEQVLNKDPENAEAYLGKLMAELKVTSKENLKNHPDAFNDNNNYKKAVRFGDQGLVTELADCIDYINSRNENNRLYEIYTNAVQRMNCAYSEQSYREAAELFKKIPDYKDSNSLFQQCLAKAEIAGQEYQRKAKQNKKIAVISTSVVSIIVVVIIILNSVIIPSVKYNKAVELLNSGKYNAAINVFSDINYKDSEEQVLASYYALGNKELENCNYMQALSAFRMAEDYSDAKLKVSQIQTIIQELHKCNIYIGFEHVIGLKSDGTVVAIGNNETLQCEVKDWSNIVECSAGAFHTLGLKSDGTVVAAGNNYYKQCNVGDWSNIVAVSAGFSHTIGLKSDGTVVAVGENKYGECDIEDWNDIVAVSAGTYHTVGLKSDGTVIATGSNGFGQCDVEEWSDIVAIFANSFITVGLKIDGTVVAVGDNSYGQCNVGDWSNIVAIAAGSSQTVGLKSDGTVVAVGDNSYGQCNVGDWSDIVAITAGEVSYTGDCTIGIRSDGTVIAVGDDTYGQCDVTEWNNIKLPNN